MTPRLRPATRDDVEQFYGVVRWTFRAIVAELDGRVLGIGGVYYDGDKTIAFTSLKPEMYEHKTTLARGMLMGMRMLVAERNCIAVADPKIPTAPMFLERMGFEKIGGGYFKWTRKPQGT